MKFSLFRSKNHQIFTFSGSSEIEKSDVFCHLEHRPYSENCTHLFRGVAPTFQFLESIRQSFSMWIDGFMKLCQDGRSLSICQHISRFEKFFQTFVKGFLNRKDCYIAKSPRKRRVLLSNPMITLKRYQSLQRDSCIFA